ncbi:hypothetical protein BY458DRAFT_505707 [Sporodiniella umbellata]|nr:hypothetical protein BY458DRAFT_505707 [Sporodiniella umbellata]
MFAAQLAQMGYPISQLPPNQQLQIQRYFSHLQMRNAAVAAATANGNSPNTNTTDTTNASPVIHPHPSPPTKF